MAFSGANHITTKIVIQKSPIEQAADFKYALLSYLERGAALHIKMIRSLKAKLVSYSRFVVVSLNI